MTELRKHIGCRYCKHSAPWPLPIPFQRWENAKCLHPKIANVSKRERFHLGLPEQVTVDSAPFCARARSSGRDMCKPEAKYFEPRPTPWWKPWGKRPWEGLQD